MPRPGPRLPGVAIRLSGALVAHIDARARIMVPLKGDGEPNRSEMIRRMLTYAAQHMPMPKDWTSA